MTNYKPQPPAPQERISKDQPFPSEPGSESDAQEKEHLEEAVVSLDSPEPTTLDVASQANDGEEDRPLTEINVDCLNEEDAESGTETDRPASDHVRVAGRKEMDAPPRKWDMVDEESDESFPASDPPANY